MTSKFRFELAFGRERKIEEEKKGGGDTTKCGTNSKDSRYFGQYK
jgi:hypothetical protein